MSSFISYNIHDIIEDVQFCCEHKRYFSSLCTALVLPDICSKIEKELYDTAQKEKLYVIWCDKWLSGYLPSISSPVFFNSSWGRVLYKLRCGILHSGETDVCGKKYNNFDLKGFNFYVNDSSSSASQLSIYNQKSSGNIGHFNEAEINIDIRYLIQVITNGTYNFINYYHLSLDSLLTIKLADNNYPYEQ